MTTQPTNRHPDDATATAIAGLLSAEELQGLKDLRANLWVNRDVIGSLIDKRLACYRQKGEFTALLEVALLGWKVLALLDTPQPAAARDPVIEAQTFAELCEREIVKIRELTLKDDEYTSHLLGEAVGSPVGITLCVEARMQQIADLQAEVKRLQKQVKGLKHTAKLDDGFIDFLTAKEGEE